MTTKEYIGTPGMLYIQDSELENREIVFVARNNAAQYHVTTITGTDPMFTYTPGTGRITFGIAFNVTPGSLASTILSLEKIKVIYK